MERWFEAEHAAPFAAFGIPHLAALGGALLAVLALYGLRSKLRHPRRAACGRYALATLLTASEALLNVWYIREGIFSAKSTLPLELCSISLYLSILMLLTRSRLLFGIVYFAGIGGALQALITPALDFGYPHFRFWQFFAAHTAIILAALYMVWVERFRPTLKSIAVTMGFLNALVVIVGYVNHVTGGNYMFLARKPDTPSLLDYLGPYPWYLLSMEGIALLTFSFLYLPFARFPGSRGAISGQSRSSEKDA
ncbi:TIGR02206 family membrane protein [Paenibacillus cisolokensis]|uniref:ABC transporter permease n=1 Tax=Paenibacillus cisolokensis TaxID=1658519 RepID=A0ABQ4NDS6_9BACL|nr:TIGR02206 family membrane protein [Paenibacillus cisolokensis]GIQ66350.1 ABC transporter permease [Paenibacillus cisolokensis]